VWICAAVRRTWGGRFRLPRGGVELDGRVATAVNGGPKRGLVGRDGDTLWVITAEGKDASAVARADSRRMEMDTAGIAGRLNEWRGTSRNSTRQRLCAKSRCGPSC